MGYLHKGGIMQKICKIEGCNKIARKNQRVCISCTNRKASGKPYPAPVFTIKPLEERLWLKVIKNENGCWLYTGGKTGSGYGVLTKNNKPVLVHRLSYNIHFGDIPPGLCVCHKCDNPLCVNPEHLFLGTHDANMKDKMKKGRAIVNQGSKHPLSKLTEENVREIKSLFGKVKQIDIAEKFKVSIATINDIKHHRGWSHIK